MLQPGGQSPPPAASTDSGTNTTLDAPEGPSPTSAHRKRKAESQDNERLSKRLSLLNLEHNGQKLYVPVESPLGAQTHGLPSSSPTPLQAAGRSGSRTEPVSDGDSPMHLDDSKHKVYIYSLDDELSSDSDPDDPASSNRLVFLPDIERHLRKHRLPPSAASPPIPRPINPNSEGELAGMQVVLYQEPSSLSVPTEKDGVRKAIVEARARTRERQRMERQGTGEAVEMPPRVDPSVVAAAMGNPAAAASPAAYANPGVSDADDAMELD